MTCCPHILAERVGDEAGIHVGGRAGRRIGDDGDRLIRDSCRPARARRSPSAMPSGTGRSRKPTAAKPIAAKPIAAKPVRPSQVRRHHDVPMRGQSSARQELLTSRIRLSRRGFHRDSCVKPTRNRHGGDDRGDNLFTLTPRNRGPWRARFKDFPLWKLRWPLSRVQSKS